ncbi:hypothetical protein GCM10007887_24330 [Methylobacterium haplocladii]|uniref:Uncharacterized protein n=1 Tax=Methylobacterium haplocladii TaxID=1176176 RepID=A0A512IP66_9HYPH|nr:hypothetical protein MHA02_18890 [Methylobacterium haplocladii]GLS59761.1 hypothetical protein GCM10007887_24330 [Methylobacterium haplocladii]
MPRQRRRQRAANSAPPSVACDDFEAVTEADRRFFARRPDAKGQSMRDVKVQRQTILASRELQIHVSKMPTQAAEADWVARQIAETLAVKAPA